MKKTVKLLSIMALFASLSMANDSNIYAGGGLAYESLPDYSDKSSGIGIVLRGGMKLDKVFEHFATEVEISKSLVDPKIGNNTYDVTTLATYAVYTIDINDKFYVKPRFGIILPNLGSSDFVNSRDIGFASGLGGGFHFDDKMDIYFDYTILGEGVTNWGSGVEYHF